MEHDTDIVRSLGRIEGNIELILDQHTRLRKDLDAAQKDIKGLQKKINWSAGAFAIIGAIGVLFIDKIKELFIA